MIQKIVFISLIFSMLSSCVSSKPAEQTKKVYVLESSSDKGIIEYGPKPESLLVLPVSMPSFLNRKNLIMKESGSQIVFARNSEWAEPLDIAIRRILRRQLSMASARFLATEDCEDCISIKVIVDKYYPNELGIVVLSGSYLLSSPNEAQQQEFSFSLTQRQEIEGYEGAVDTMKSLLYRLSNQIGTQILLWDETDQER